MRSGPSGGRSAGKGWVGDSTSPATPPCGDWALLDRQDGLAGLAVEHKDQPLLGALDDDVALLAVECDRGEARLRRDVIIPEIVVHELVAPHHARRSRP